MQKFKLPTYPDTVCPNHKRQLAFSVPTASDLQPSQCEANSKCRSNLNQVFTTGKVKLSTLPTELQRQMQIPQIYKMIMWPGDHHPLYSYPEGYSGCRLCIREAELMHQAECLGPDVGALAKPHWWMSGTCCTPQVMPLPIPACHQGPGYHRVNFN